MQRLNLYTEQGGVTLTTGGISSSTKVMGVFPGATVSVFNQGTLVLSTIFSDQGITPKSNPFTSDSITGLGFFLAANGHYDLQFSGTGFSTFTLADIILDDPGDAMATLTVTGNATIGGALNTKQLGQVLYADQFAGVDMGAKINAAIAAAPATGCIIDATSFLGAQAAASTIALSKPVFLKLGEVTLTCAASPGISITAVGSSIVGLGMDTTILQTSSGTADILQLGAAFFYVAFMGFRSTVARTGGAGINMVANGSNGTGQSLRFDKTWNGIACTVSTSVGNSVFSDIQMGAGLSATGNWNAGVLLGGVNAGTVASMSFDALRITGDAAFATAMVVLDSGTDTIMFSNSQLVQSGISNTCLLVQKTGASLTPSWARFSNTSFEGFTAGIAVNVTSCNNLKFINCQIANSLIGIQINPASPTNVSDLRFINGSFITCQQQAVALNVCTGGVEVSNCWVADSSQQTNGGFNSITVNGNCANFWFNHNSFALSGRGNGFLPFVDIAINNAGCDNFDLIGNSYLQGITNNSTGTNYSIHSSIPAQANIFNGAMSFKSGVNTPLGLGTANTSSVGLIVLPSNLTGTSQIGIQSAPITSTAATVEGSGLFARCDTPNSSFTQALNTGVHVTTPTKGAASTITEWDGLRIDAGPTAGTSFAIKSLATAPAQFADYVQSKRLRANQGTAYSGADAAIVINASWGTTATKSAATGFDQAFQFTVNSAGTGQAASPTIVITFKDGTWTNVPIVDVSRNDNATPTTSTFFPVWTTTATVLTITMNGTPTAGQSYIFTVMVFGT